MKKFLPKTLFNLSTFSHSQLFDSCSYAWEALIILTQYLEKQKLGKIECPIPSGAYLINPEQISIGKGTIIEPGAYIQGPCLIGKECEIRHGAYIRGNVLIGNRCVIGHATEVKKAILLDNVQASHFNYIGDSILGNRVHLGAGVKLANVRFDGKEVNFFEGKEKILTGLKKLGAILGDDTKLGCNAVTNPGTIMEMGSICHPCEIKR